MGCRRLSFLIAENRMVHDAVIVYPTLSSLTPHELLVPPCRYLGRVVWLGNSPVSPAVPLRQGGLALAAMSSQACSILLIHDKEELEADNCERKTS